MAAALGWIVSARLAGEEARKTEAAKRRIADAAHRDFVRARLDRVWAIVEEAVGVKPYQPDVVEGSLPRPNICIGKSKRFSVHSHENIALSVRFSTERVSITL